jgi:formate hydrogenlyase subunit 6/NADH:ubiquinone oxidoreductase subunit I
MSNKRFQRTSVLARLTWKRCRAPLKRNTLGRRECLRELALGDALKVALYYFTGTGNCLAVARTVSARFGCQPVRIADVAGEPSVRTDADTVVMVFPAYLSALHGVPPIVERFVLGLEDLESKRLIAICTCGGYEMFNAVPALISLAKVVERAGSRLAAEYTVRLPMNNLDYGHIPVPIETDSAVIISKADVRIGDICDRIANGRNGRHHALGRLVTVVMAPAYSAMAKATVQLLKELAGEPADSDLGFRELMPLTDRSIKVDANCTGCGICTQVCPVGNIELVDGKPSWLHRCEMCCGCDEWCPSGAVRHWQRSRGTKYHHPSVRAKDLRAHPGSACAAQQALPADSGSR